jgi:hypothetical protein
MPFKSSQQRKWAYSKEGMKALGGKAKVAEWESATGNKKLPKYVKGSKHKPENMLKSAMKRLNKK